METTIASIKGTEDNELPPSVDKFVSSEDLMIKGFPMDRSIEVTEDNELSSSVDKVFSSEDLMIEILVRLPLISLHLFRFVSKWWLSLITSPKFIMRRSRIPNLDPPSGLFLCGNRYSDEHDFLPLDIRINPANGYPLSAPLAAGSTLTILDSCNGLLLCSTDCWTDVYVYNPSINNMFKMLPNICDMYLYLNDSYGGLKMAFDPTKSPYYKVVNAQYFSCNADRIEIRTYSSKTGNWSVYGDHLYKTGEFESFSKGIYWNDAIHWVNRRDGENIVYHKLDVEHQSKTNILITNAAFDDTEDCKYFQLFESRGCLLFVTMYDTPVLEIEVYEMSDDDDDCPLKYCVTLDEGWRSTPTNILDSFGVLSIMLGEREEDSFLVMFLDGKVVRYDLVSRNVSTLTNYRSSHTPLSFQFIASVAHV